MVIRNLCILVPWNESSFSIGRVKSTDDVFTPDVNIPPLHVYYILGNKYSQICFKIFIVMAEYFRGKGFPILILFKSYVS